MSLIHHLFAAQAARTPTAVAVLFNGLQLTYRELNARVDVLAAHLVSRGVGPNVLVGLYLHRSLDMIVGLLGILKAGGAYLPLDPAFPRDRIAFMLEDSRTETVVTQQSLHFDLRETGVRLVAIDDLPAKEIFSQTASEANPTNLAYVIYTSGSTGRPKGVEIEHHSVVSFLDSMRREPGLNPNDVVLALTTLSFDIAALEIFLPLTTGARVVVCSRDTAVDGTAIARAIAQNGVTVMQATPVTWRMLIEAGWKGDKHLKILCGGEAIDQSLAEALLLRCGELWNMYGPTETTIWSTIERLLPDQPITIGRPIANTQTYILDDTGQATPPGEIGELYIGGEGVARGYLNRPELTAEKFIRDPFNQKGSHRLFRTGDLARFRPDGRIDFLGRADHQVKIRGFRIETGEVESALTSLKGVAQAVVIAREDIPGDKRLVAYVVLKVSQSVPFIPIERNKEGVALDVDALRSGLLAILPDYMLPSAFVFLEAFPLTPNGKVDRKALPKPGKIDNIEIRYEAPQGLTEVKLAAIMSKLLRVPRVGRSDDFFALGGHSILAVSLFNEIERLFGKRMPLPTLFRAPTVAALAKMLDMENATEERWGSLIPIQTQGEKPRFFCVHGAGGNIVLYRDLVRSLGSNYPFYGLQSLGLDRQTKPLTTVEKMAEHYLLEIRALQPEGPYLLGGYCMGGTIAYEMALQLHRSGHRVGLLALFDTYNFTEAGKNLPLRYFWQKIIFHLGNLTSLPWKDLAGYLSNKIRIATDGELRALWKGLAGSLRRKREQVEFPTVEIRVQEINDAAAASYKPGTYAGLVTVFKPRINYDLFPDPKMGWGDLAAGGLDIVELPVNPHAMLVSPFVSCLADELRRKIDQAASGCPAAAEEPAAVSSSHPALEQQS